MAIEFDYIFGHSEKKESESYPYFGYVHGMRIRDDPRMVNLDSPRPDNGVEVDIKIIDDYIPLRPNNPFDRKLAKTKPSDFIIAYTSWDPIDKIKQLEEKTMEFKIGDIVEIIENPHCHPFGTYIGAIASISDNGKSYNIVGLPEFYYGKYNPKVWGFLPRCLKLISRPSQTEDHFVDALRYAFSPFSSKEPYEDMIREQTYRDMIKKVGAEVKILKSDFTNCIGKIGRLVSVEDTGIRILYSIQFGGESYKYCTDNESGDKLEFLPIPKFKIGDRVKIVNSEGYLLPSDSCGVIVRMGKLVGYSILLDDLASQLWFVNDSSLEKLEATPEPKIDAVVKCIDNTKFINELTINKFYPVINETSAAYQISNDKDCIGSGYYKHRFTAFKVGDRFKHANSIVTIYGFQFEEKVLYIEYRYADLSSHNHIWEISAFDRQFTKIEDEPVKQEPVKQEPKPKFELGQRVKVSGCFDHLKEGYVIYVNYNESRSEFTYSVEDGDPVSKKGVGNIPESSLKLVEEPKPEWQPKFKVGDWVINNNGIVIKIKGINNFKSKSYEVFCANGNISCLFECEEDIKLWQPMQELKDQNEAQAKNIRIHLARIQDLESNAIRLRTLVDGKNKMLDREYAANRALKREIEQLRKKILGI